MEKWIHGLEDSCLNTTLWPIAEACALLPTDLSTPQSIPFFIKVFQNPVPSLFPSESPLDIEPEPQSTFDPRPEKNIAIHLDFER